MNLMRTLQLLVICVPVLITSTIVSDGEDFSHKKPGYYGGNGTSMDQAVVVVGFDYTPAAWIAKKYPGSTIKDQSLVGPPTGTKRYDVYSVEKSDGKTVKVWFLASGGLDDLISSLAKLDYPTVELPEAATDAGDGFRIKFDVIRLARETPNHTDYVSIIYDVYVPNRVGKTQLDQVALEVLGDDGRTLIYAPLEPQNDKGKPPKFHVSIDRELTAQSVLHCTYYNPSTDHTAKDYLVRLRYHLPAPE